MKNPDKFHPDDRALGFFDARLPNKKKNKNKNKIKMSSDMDHFLIKKSAVNHFVHSSYRLQTATS